MPKLRVAALMLLAVCAGCTDDPAPDPTAAPAPASPALSSTALPSAAPSSAAPSSAPAASGALKIPAPVEGELVRQVISRKNGAVAGETTVRAEAKAGQEYATRVACTATGPGRTLSYDVTSDGKLIAAAEDVPCD